jgi:hypothetical protein
MIDKFSAEVGVGFWVIACLYKTRSWYYQTIMTLCKIYRVGAACIFVLVNHLYLLHIEL